MVWPWKATALGTGAAHGGQKARAFSDCQVIDRKAPPVAVSSLSHAGASLIFNAGSDAAADIGNKMPRRHVPVMTANNAKTRGSAAIAP
jgi:hypothetical protein